MPPILLNHSLLIYFDKLIVQVSRSKNLNLDYGKTPSTLFFSFRTPSQMFFNPRSLLEKIVTRSLGGGGSIGPAPSTFDTIHPIDLKFGTYNKLHLYFQFKRNHVVS